MNESKEQSIKYHQAAFMYLLNISVYFLVLIFRMPPHDFGRSIYLFYSLVPVFAFVFPYLIYKEYFIFTAILTMVCFMKAIFLLLEIPYYSILIIFIFILNTLTCFMLARAAWNIEILKRG
ncbi:MAG: hypothetical protein AABZ11_00220 [Nitrospinota bacterium]